MVKAFFSKSLPAPAQNILCRRPRLYRAASTRRRKAVPAGTACVTPPKNIPRSSAAISAGNCRGSNPLSSIHFHRRLSATEPVDDASAMRPLSDVGEPAVGLYLHGAHLVRSRRIRHFMPTTGVPAPQDPHKTADRRHPGGDHRRPHQYLSQPHAPLNSDDPLLRVPKSGQLVHAHRDAHDRLGENALHGQQGRRRSL